MNILVILDWQNIFKTCQQIKLKLDEVFEEIHRRVLERGTLFDFRLFVPNFQLTSSPWRLLNEFQLRFGASVEVCPTLREGAEMEEGFKDMVDLSTLLWVTKSLHQGVGPQLVVFVCGDGHFLLTANEAKSRGKEVEFWTPSPERTSGMIFKLTAYREIQAPAMPIMSESNAFIQALDVKQRGGGLSESEQSRIILLQRAVEVLAGFEKPVCLESKMEALSQKLQKECGTTGQESTEMLKALLVLGGARISPVTSQSLYIDRTSPFLQWLKLG